METGEERDEKAQYRRLQGGRQRWRIMGLDMYLSKKTYVKNWEHTPADERYEVAITRGGQPVDARVIDPDKVSYIVEDVGYWRKANAIHHWFVECVQNGTDDCGAYYVSREKLALLLQTVNVVLKTCMLVDGQVTNGSTLKNGPREAIVESGKVINDPSIAQQVLPTHAGFFFGSTDYDAGYYQELVETKRILDEVMGSSGEDFEYSSSW